MPRILQLRCHCGNKLQALATSGCFLAQKRSDMAVGLFDVKNGSRSFLVRGHAWLLRSSLLTLRFHSGYFFFCSKRTENGHKDGRRCSYQTMGIQQFRNSPYVSLSSRILHSNFPGSSSKRAYDVLRGNSIGSNLAVGVLKLFALVAT